MELVLQENINDVLVDGLYENEAWFTRTQIGQLLEYDDPSNSILQIHKRHRERLDKFSRGCQFVTPSGVQEGFVYNIRGVFEICRWSKQPKADAIMNALYDMAIRVEREGYVSKYNDVELFQMLGKKLQDDPKLYAEAIAPLMANVGSLNAMDVVWEYLKAIGYEGMGYETLRKVGKYQRKRDISFDMIERWEKSGDNHFTIDSISPKMREELDKHTNYQDYHIKNAINELSKSKVYKEEFCRLNGEWHFSKVGYVGIIKYIEDHNLISPEIIDGWKAEACIF